MDAEQKAVNHASTLVRGICMAAAEEFQHCCMAEDYQEVLDFLNEHLPPAIKRFQEADEKNPRSRRRRRVHRRKPEIELPVQ